MAVFLLALVMRAGWGTLAMLRTDDPQRLEFPDEVDYWNLARSLADGRGLVGEHGFRALRMPLYPAWLSVFAPSDRGVIWARIAQWPIGALAAVFTALIAARVGGRVTGVIAGGLVAVDPFLTFFASLLLTETPYLTAQGLLLWAGWELLLRHARSAITRWLAVGVGAALCVYLREAAVLLCLAWIALLVACSLRDRSAIVGGLLAVLVVAGALLPWAVRNQHVTGRLCWLTHRAGISLYDGVGPQATGASDLADIKQMPAVRGLDEVAWNRYFMVHALQSTADDPARVLRLIPAKLARTWNPVPNVDTYRSPWVRLVSAVWTIPIYALAALGTVRLWRRHRPQTVALLLPAVTILLLHSLFVGSVRYRLPAIPTLEILAAFALARFLTPRKASPDRATGSRPAP